MTFYLPTASKVKVMVKGIDIDLAFRLDWKETQPKIPIYGYNDQEYTRTIAGRRLIQGFLVMNYVAPHYLAAVLHQAELEAFNKDIQDRQEQFQALPQNLTADERRARAETISELLLQDSKNLSKSILTDNNPQSRKDKENQARELFSRSRHLQSVADGGLLNPGLLPPNSYKKQLFEMFGKGPTQLVNVTDPPLVTTFAYNTPFPMEIYHLEPEFAPWYVVLEDVEITDVSQSASAAGADGSSDPLYETYEFIAKRRTVYRTNRPNKGR